MQKSVQSGFRFSWLCGFFSLILITCVASAAFAADVVITVTATTVGGGNGGTVTANHPIVGGKITVPEGPNVVSFTVQANSGYYIKEVNFDSEANLIDDFPIATFYLTIQNIPAGQYSSGTT